MNFKYQIIPLEVNNVAAGLAPLFYVPKVPVFPDKQYNNIHSYCFYIPDYKAPLGFINSAFSQMNFAEIREFKISDYEIVGERTPLKALAWGNSIKLNNRFTEINIPNNFNKINIIINIIDAVRIFGNPETIYLVLKLNNVLSEKDYFKNYHRIETNVFKITNSPLTKIQKFNYRPRIGSKKLKGLAFNFLENSLYKDFDFFSNYVPYTGLPVNVSNASVGKISFQLNSLKSNPVVANCFDVSIQDIVRKADFLQLDEPIEPNCNIDGYFKISQNVLGTVPNFNLYITNKYATNLTK